MKKLLLGLTSALALTVAHGQYFIAGTHGLIYLDITPDTLLNPTTSNKEYYYIDINQDGTNDVKINVTDYQTVLIEAFSLDKVLAGINSPADINNSIAIVPNPFSTQATLQPNKFFRDATLTVDNCFGQAVKQIKNISGQIIIFS